MKKLSNRILASLIVFAVSTCSCIGCSKDGNSDVDLEKTVYLGLLEEVKALDISDTAKRKMENLSQVALDKDASVSEIMDAISELNSIKNEFLNEALVFVDPALKSKVSKALGKTENAVITVKDVLNVKVLDLSYTAEDEKNGAQKIHYLSDLRKFPLLKEVNLDGNELYSLDGAENLVVVEEFSVSDCFAGDSPIDISPLTHMESLTTLDISNNNIESISQLSTLKNLKALDVSGVTASDLFVIAGFTNLTELGIANLTVSGAIFTAMEDLTVLDISGTEFTSPPIFTNLSKLEKLVADGMKSDITAQIGTLANLTALTVSNSGLKSAEFISNLTKLEYLNGANNEISDISFIFGLKNLSRLNLSENNLTEFTSEGMPSLLTLNIADNKISTLTLLGDHSSLVKINAENNALSAVKTEKLSGLTEIDISNNPIYNGEFFKEFTEIKKISANETEFEYLDLSACKKLAELSLEKVPLKSTAGLRGLTMLQKLNLYGTEIEDIAAFIQMEKLKTLKATFKNIEDYAPLSGLISIESVELYRMNKADWEMFRTMSTLKKVYIENSYMKEPEISGLPLLEELTLVDCEYTTSTAEIKELPNLKILTIDGSDIATPIISQLPNLETLNLINSDVEYPNKISDLPRLKHLDLSGNDLEALEFSELPALEYLDVSNCRVVTIKDLNAEMSYGTLILANNYISDISILDDVYKAMKKLDISNNKIKKYEDLDAIEIEEIIASGNKKEYTPKQKEE